MKHAYWVLPLVAFTFAGCNCKGCANDLSVDKRDAGSGGNALDGGGGNAGGGAGGGGGDADAGDGNTYHGVAPGGWILDGGAGASGDGVKLDADGGLVLNSNDVQLHFMWIANNSEGTVSKFDTKTGKEVARYYSVIPIDGKGNPNGLTGDPGYGNSPSRTGIDLYGDVWIANRAPGDGKQGSATKIANDPASCVDRNGNGKIDTSTDADGDGVISPAEMITPTNWADPMQYDECVLFTTALGNPCPAGSGGCVNARALAISVGVEANAGTIWVGMYQDQRVYKLSSADGTIQPVDSNGKMWIDLGWGPYGAAVDGQQRLWLTQPGAAHLALVDTNTSTLITDAIVPPTSHNCNGAYGIAIDGKDRVWLAGWGSSVQACASRYDHGPGLSSSIGTWTEFDFTSATSQANTPFGVGRGVAADDQNTIWLTGSYTVGYTAPVAHLIHFDADTGAIIPFQTASGSAQFIDATDNDTNQSVGVGLDGDGQPWVNNYSGNAMRIDKTTGAILKTASQAGTLYSYSDFTGYQLRHFTAPQGKYRQDFPGCGPNTTWSSLSWQSSTPTGTTIDAYIIVADTQAALNSSSATKYGPFSVSPADLVAAGVPHGGYARVEFVLKSLDAKTTPELFGFQLVSSCGFN